MWVAVSKVARGGARGSVALALMLAVTPFACTGEASVDEPSAGSKAGKGGTGGGPGAGGGKGGSDEMGGAGGEDPMCETGDPCTMNYDCPGGTRCNGQVCTRLFCLPNGERCDTPDVCETQHCVGSPTGPVCWEDEPLGDGWDCDPEECESGLECVFGVCRKPGTILEGEACVWDDQCAPGLFCYTFECGGSGTCSEPLPLGGECCTDSDCATPNVCRTGRSCSLFACGPLSDVLEPCCSTVDCEAGLRCNTTTERCEDPNAPVLRTSPTMLTFSFVQGGEPPDAQTLTAYNAGTGSLDFYATTSLAALKVTPVYGTVSEDGETVDMVVTVTDTNLSPGTFKGTLNLKVSSPMGDDASIPITLNVSLP